MRGVTAAGRAGEGRLRWEGRGEVWGGLSAHALCVVGGGACVPEPEDAKRMRFKASRRGLAPEGPLMVVGGWRSGRVGLLSWLWDRVVLRGVVGRVSNSGTGYLMEAGIVNRAVRCLDPAGAAAGVTAALLFPQCSSGSEGQALLQIAFNSLLSQLL